MNEPVAIEELKNVVALRDLPEEHLRWILDHSELREFEDGAVITNLADRMDHMWILLEGKAAYYKDVNGTLVYYLTFENDTLTGGITGLIPYSRMKVVEGSLRSIGHLRALLLHRTYFGELEQLNPDFVQRLIGYMTERARRFATIQLQYEKVSALGTLSAGIAHELNNPAAAISRIASELRKRLDSNFELTSRLLSSGVTTEQIRMIHDLATQKQSSQNSQLSALQRMEKEDEIADWLQENGAKEYRQAAETFSEFGFSTDELGQLRQGVSKNAFVDLLAWLENVLISGRLMKDLEDASGRISHLVGAIKSHVHMDQSNDVQRTNIYTDIENTLALMGYKLRDKNIALTKNFNPDMPPVEAYVGELNQVWTNLIDNAVDAVEKNGELTIETSFDTKDAIIRMIDNGAGIPHEIQSRIFDPFFTTKKVGQGTGIGLDIVKKIIERHHGEIKVNSRPGRTEFVVCIPISQPRKATE